MRDTIFLSSGVCNYERSQGGLPYRARSGWAILSSAVSVGNPIECSQGGLSFWEWSGWAVLSSPARVGFPVPWFAVQSQGGRSNPRVGCLIEYSQGGLSCQTWSGWGVLLSLVSGRRARSGWTVLSSMGCPIGFLFLTEVNLQQHY